MKFWNFELFTSLPSLHLLLCFPSDAVDAERRGRRPRAAPSSRPQPFHVPGSSRSISAPPRGAISLRARRGSTPSRHDEAVPSRPTAHHPLPSLVPSICFTSELSTSPSAPLPAPSAGPSLSRRPEPPPTPLAPPLLRPPRSSSLRPSSRPTDPPDSSPTLRWCSPTCSPPPRPAGNAAAADQSVAGRPSPRRGHHRPPSRAPSPSKGSSCAPLAFPQWGPHRRSLSSPGKAASYLLCSFPVQGPALRRNRSPGGQAQKRHELKTANFENT